MVNSARYLKASELSSGKLGVTGFCWGGFATNHLAVVLGADLNAAVPFYGRAPDPAEVSKIGAPLLAHYAETDDNVNATRADFEAALKENGVEYEMHVYPGTKHGFHNNSTPRYDEAAADLAWERTIAFFKARLA
jgi:carboxymethylenebutenolidase